MGSGLDASQGYKFELSARGKGEVLRKFAFFLKICNFSYMFSCVFMPFLLEKFQIGGIVLAKIRKFAYFPAILPWRGLIK